MELEQSTFLSLFVVFFNFEKLELLMCIVFFRTVEINVMGWVYEYHEF